MKYKAIRGFNVRAPQGWKGKGKLVEASKGKELRFEPGDTFSKLPKSEDLEHFLRKGVVVPVDKEIVFLEEESSEKEDE